VTEEEVSLNRYEALFIVDNDLGESGVEQVLDLAQKEISDAGGTIEGIDRLGKRTLTHAIRKRTHGYYAFVEFEGPGEAVDKLMSRYRLTEGLLRAHIVRARGPGQQPKPETGEDDGVPE
jgi:small subunit ribosomal protein S6